MGFVRPHATIIVGTVVLMVALVFHIVALAAPGWFSVELGEKGKSMIGMWEYCYEQPKFNCENVSNHVTVEAWLEAARAFAILALLVMMFSAACSFLLCCFSQVRILFTLTPLSALIAALLIFIEFFAFTGGLERRKNTMGQHFRFQYCFGLAIVGFVFTLISALCFCIGNGRNSKQRK